MFKTEHEHTVFVFVFLNLFLNCFFCLLTSYLTWNGKRYLGAIIGPGTKLHGTILQVKREEGDVDGAGRLVIGWRRPRYGSVILDDSLGDGALKSPVRAVEREHSAHSSVILHYWLPPL